MDDTARLRKNLGLIHVFAIALGSMISSGLFVIAGMDHAIAGPGVVWAYLLAGLLASTGALSLAELTTAMPRAGGNYFYTMRAFGAVTDRRAGGGLGLPPAWPHRARRASEDRPLALGAATDARIILKMRRM